jgi:hypothetical protein
MPTNILAVSLLFRSKISKWLFRQCIHHDLGLRIAITLLFVAPPMRVVHDTIGIPITGARHLARCRTRLDTSILAGVWSNITAAIKLS